MMLPGSLGSAQFTWPEGAGIRFTAHSVPGGEDCANAGEARAIAGTSASNARALLVDRLIANSLRSKEECPFSYDAGLCPSKKAQIFAIIEYKTNKFAFPQSRFGNSSRPITQYV